MPLLLGLLGGSAGTPLDADDDRRLSYINIMSPWRGILPLPDGSIDSDDRLVFLFLGHAPTATGNPSVGSWVLSEVGRWFLRALADYRGTPQYVQWRESELYRAFLQAVTTYDAGAPYPPLSPEWAQRFLDYLVVNGG